jgi:hypothetical protein
MVRTVQLCLFISVYLEVYMNIIRECGQVLGGSVWQTTVLLILGRPRISLEIGHLWSRSICIVIRMTRELQLSFSSCKCFATEENI